MLQDKGMLKLSSELMWKRSLDCACLLIVLLGAAVAQLTPAAQSPANQAGSTNSPSAAPKAGSRYRPSMPKRALDYYETQWGVDAFTLKAVESGEMIRFTYRVIDAQKAAPLNDKRNEPSLVDEQAGVRLQVPSLEKVGQLRQSNTPEAGKIYWMAFANKERYVKRGHRVSVLIGKFRVDNLLVE
jgi:hypothetical protein